MESFYSITSSKAEREQLIESFVQDSQGGPTITTEIGNIPIATQLRAAMWLQKEYHMSRWTDVAGWPCLAGDGTVYAELHSPRETVYSSRPAFSQQTQDLEGSDKLLQNTDGLPAKQDV